MNFHLVMKGFFQCFLLASAGVVLFAYLLALLVHSYFPYGWDFYESMALGGILAATDPVAVVAILNDLGASAKLNTIISGESLMNDGVSIVIFNPFFDMANGKHYTVG